MKFLVCHVLFHFLFLRAQKKKQKKGTTWANRNMGLTQDLRCKSHPYCSSHPTLTDHARESVCDSMSICLGVFVKTCLNFLKLIY
jgi:hypothetical protein